MKRFFPVAALLGFASAVAAFALLAQGPPRRPHTVTQSDGMPKLVPATQRPPGMNRVTITVEGEQRVIDANGIPDHATGMFPNRGNPHPITPQSYRYRVPAKPRTADRVTPLGMHNFGIAVNGVPFDPGAAEWYLGDPSGGWQYEPLSGAIALGIDVSHAHVQPSGAYHYHGLPTRLLESVKISKDRHSPVVGWAADGFPIYAVRVLRPEGFGLTRQGAAFQLPPEARESPKRSGRAGRHV